MFTFVLAAAEPPAQHSPRRDPWHPHLLQNQGGQPRIQLRRRYPEPAVSSTAQTRAHDTAKAVDAAFGFLTNQAASLTLGGFDLRKTLVLNQVITNVYRHHPERGMDYTVEYRQYYAGVPVYGGECRIALNNRYEVWQFNNELREITCRPLRPKLNSDRAWKTIAKGYPALPAGVEPQGALYYWAPARLVWAFDVPPPYGRRVFVDSISGAVVSDQNHIHNLATTTLTVEDTDHLPLNHVEIRYYAKGSLQWWGYTYQGQAASTYASPGQDSFFRARLLYPGAADVRIGNAALPATLDSPHFTTTNNGVYSQTISFTATNPNLSEASILFRECNRAYNFLNSMYLTPLWTPV